MRKEDRVKILVFEDDPIILKLLKNVLKVRGYDVSDYREPTMCPIYYEPQCTCPKESPCADVIISDITMPKMDGIEFFESQHRRGCKAIPENKALMSSGLTAERKKKVRELGCRYFEKPYRTDEIVRWVDECAERVHRRI